MHFDEYDVQCQKDWGNRIDNVTSLAEISEAWTILEGTEVSYVHLIYDLEGE